MKFIMTAVLMAILLSTIFVQVPASAESCDAAAEALGWKLGVQAYTFNRFTFFDAVDKAAGMGMKYIEAYPDQKLSTDGDATTHYSMDGATRKKMLDKIKSAGLTLVAYGVVGCSNEAEWRKLFEFAKAMNIGTIVTEPEFDQLDTVSKLCDEFGINAAIHNHPSPTRYWDPDIVLKALKGKSNRMGACADTGHWLRSGLDPLECLKKLKGRIVHSHFKDLNKKEAKGTSGDDRTAHDVPWGTGVANVDVLLAELKRQGYKGMFSVEYEHNWDNSVPEITKCAAYFHQATSKLGKSK